MPTDPRMVAAPSSPNAAPVSAAALNNVYNALLDLSRRIDRLEASRTVIQADTITSTHIAAGSIHASEIEVGNIVASIMTVGAVNASHIDASSIRASVLDATVLTATNAFITSLRASILDAGVLTATNATIGTLRASIINGAQIVAQNLQAQVLTAVNAAITNLSSFGVTTGTLTADLIRTAASGARVEVGSSAGGIKGYNSGGTMTFGFDVTTGAATVGAISVTGAFGTQVPASTLTGFVGGGNLLLDSSGESTDPALPAGLWSQNGALITKQTTQAFHGTKSFRLVYSSSPGQVYSNVVGQHNVPAAALKNRPVVFSAWVYITGADNTTPATNKSIQIEDDVSGVLASAPIANIPKNAWTRVIIKGPTNASAANVYVSLFNPYSSGSNTVYYDGLQFELGDAATAYNPKADEIIYGSITAVQIAAASIDATKLSVSTLSAISANMGTITAGTITGATFQSAVPGVARTVMDIDGLRFNDGLADTVNLSAATNGLTLLAATTDLPPTSRKITYLHAAAGATAGEMYVLSNSSGTPTFSNPSATTDLSSWTILVSGSASVTRDTTVYDSSPASFKFTGDAGSNARAYTTMTGTFKAGVTYRVPFSYRAASGVNPQIVITSDPVSLTTQHAFLNIVGAGAGSWVRTYIEWTPQVDVVSPSFYVTSPAGPAPVSNFDTFGPVELMTRMVLTASAKTGGIDSAGISVLTKRSNGTTATATLLNDNGESDFLRFTQLRTSKMNFGRQTVSWPGGTPFSTSQVVNHNLGAVPANVQIIGIGGTTASFFVDSATSTSITFRGREMSGASPANNTTIDAFWLAIGG